MFILCPCLLSSFIPMLPLIGRLLVSKSTSYPVIRTIVTRSFLGPLGAGLSKSRGNLCSSNVSAIVVTTRKMASEQDLAQTAKPGGDTIFGKILRGEIPTNFIYEDDQVSFIPPNYPNLPVRFTGMFFLLVCRIQRH